jgi:hypothetical protein
MPRPDPRTIAASETRSAGGRARAEREAAQARADEGLSGLMDKALGRLELLLDSDDDSGVARASARSSIACSAGRTQRMSTRASSPWKSSAARNSCAPRSRTCAHGGTLGPRERPRDQRIPHH